MQIADLAALRVPSEPTLSPDGRHAVVAVSRPDLDADDYRSQLWLVPTDGSAPPRRFTHGPKDTFPRLSPDGRWLAFLRAQPEGKPQVHVMPADGGEPRRLTDHPLGAAQLTWSPDSTRLAYVARVPEEGRYGTDEKITPDQEPPRRITTNNYRLDDLGYTIDRRPHVFLVDAQADDPQPQQVTDGDFDHADPAWGPDGRHLAFVSARHDSRDEDLISDVFVAAVGATGATARQVVARQVTRSTLTIARPVFTPDGGSIVFLAESEPDVVGRNTVMWRVLLDGSAAPSALTDREAWSFDSFGTGSTIPLLAGDDAVASLSQRRGALELVRVPLDGGEPTVEVGGRRQVRAADRANGVTVCLVADGTNAGELVAVDREGRERVLTDFGATLARAASLRPLEELTATSPDGYQVHGWVVRPSGRGPFPVLLSIHGGPFTQYGWTLFDEAQVYAGAGYAVVMGNPRGSSGYGESHGRAIVGDLGNLDHADLLALLDAALADPELDGERVGVMGGSYGGFMASWMVGHSDRFAAGISERAVNAWDSFSATSDIGWYFTDAYCGPDPERQHAQSPLTHADAIHTPLLLIHSEQDWRCPVEQAQRLYRRLKRNQVPVELLLFPGEGHELSRSGLPSHRVARFEAILDWWDRHLRPSRS